MEFKLPGGLLDKNETGFTLIETLIALCLIGLLVSLCYVVITSGSTALYNGASSLKIQNDARLTAEAVAREVRNARDVELLDAVPRSFESGWRYIYCDGRSVVFKDAAETRRAGGSVEHLSFELLLHDNNANLIRYTVGTGGRGKQYRLTTELLLNNLQGKTPISPRPVLRYRLPP